MTSTLRARLAVLGVAGAAFLAAAPAQAADRDASVSAATPTAAWTSPFKAGFVYTSSVSSQIPACTEVIFACDTTLVKVEDENLRVRFKTASKDTDTLSDVDLHVYRSDENGTMGALLGESTSPAVDETVTVNKAAPGHYLVVVDWYLGAGTYDGSVQLTPLPPA
jgi:hypothetical protein